ncbi:MAG: hypothetical protein WC998_00575 [Candidatus Paceibacterota bacterium]|jgi:hypothetical protein
MSTVTTWDEVEGWVFYPNAHVIPNRTLTLVNGLQTALAGEIVWSAPYFGLITENAATGNKRGLIINSIIKSGKTNGAIVDGDYLTLVPNPDVTKNDYLWETAGAGDAIYGVALESAAIGTTYLLVHGPFGPPNCCNQSSGQ